MKKALPAIVLFVLFLSCGHPAAGQRTVAGQRSQPAASQKSLDIQLIQAISKGQSDKIASLLKQGANIEARVDKSGVTALLIAAFVGQADMVRLLLEKGANIEVKDNDGDTALFDASTKEVAQLLLDKGADVHVRNKKNETPLFRVQSVEVAELLLDQGVDVNVRNEVNETALVQAVGSGHAEIVKVLLDKGADVDARDQDNETPLIHAAYSGYTEIVKLLLDKGANTEARDRFGDRSINIATLNGKTEVVKALLEKGANIEARDQFGRTALLLACGMGRKEDPELLKLLLNNGANVEIIFNGFTPLMFVADQNNIFAMKLLLDRGANIEARGMFGNTALLWAVDAGTSGKGEISKIDVVKLLLDRGANIEAKTDAGETALDIANRNESIAMADLIEQAVRKRKQIQEAQAKDPRNIFAASLNAFQQNPKDESLREKVIQLSFNLPNPQPIPEEARQLFALSTDQIKQAGTPAALDQPIVLLRKALEIAPWWSNAYYNLSRVLEMRGQYDDAARQLNYYLELKPAGADAGEARAHLVVIQTEKDAAAKQ